MGRSVIYVCCWVTVGIVEEDLRKQRAPHRARLGIRKETRSAARLFFASIVIVDADSHVMVMMVVSNAHHVVVMMMVMMMMADLDRHLC
jgi:hypothetical protein